MSAVSIRTGWLHYADCKVLMTSKSQFESDLELHCRDDVNHGCILRRDAAQ